MKTICFGVALAIALPNFATAQTTPANPAHTEHQEHMDRQDHKGMGDKDCCCQKMKAEGDKMDCCDKSASNKADAHAGHEAGQH